MIEIKKKLIFFLASFILVFLLLFLLSSNPKLTLFSIKSTEDSLFPLSEINIPEINDGMEEILNGYKYSNSSGIILSTEPMINCHWKNPKEDDSWKICEAIFQIDNLGKNSIKLDSAKIDLKFEKPNDVRNLEILYSDEYTLIYEDSENIEVKEEKVMKISNQEEDNNIEKPDVTRNIVENNKNKFKKRSFYNFGKIENLNKKITLKENETLDNEIIENKTEENYELNGSNINTELNNETDENTEKNINNENQTNNLIENNSELTKSREEESNDYEENGSNIEVINPEPLGNSENSENSVINIEENNDKNTVEINDEYNNFDNENSNTEEDKVTETAPEINTISIEDKRSYISGLVIDMLEDENEVNFKPVAVKVRFEIPKYSSNSFDFLISENDIEARIDPEASICGDLNSENFVYILDRDFISSETCFTISAENITLDCQGHSIGHSTESPGYGIYSSYSKTKIKNCVIYEGDNDITPTRNIFLSESSDSEIINNTLNISGIGNYNLYIEGGTNNKIIENDIKVYGADSYGIYADYTTINLSNNNLTTYAINNYAVYSNLVYDSLFTNNIFHINGDNSFPLLFQSSSSTEFNNNKIISQGNNVYSLYLDATESLNIFNNNITSYGENNYNIFIVNFTNNSHIDSNYLTLVNEVSSSCSIILQNSFFDEMDNNKIFTSGVDSEGICLNYASNFSIINNDIYSFIDDISFVNSIYGEIRNNNLTVLGLIGYGIYSSENSNLNFENNSFYSYNDNSYGFYGEYLKNSTIQKNNFFTFYPNSFSIYLTSESNNNKIVNNIIDSKGIQSYGLSLSASNFINFSNNNISCYSRDGKCVYLSELYYSTLFNNSIIISNETPYGLYINTDSSHNKFEFNNIFSDVPYSISTILKSSTNNSFVSNNLTNTGISGTALFVTTNPLENYFNENFITSTGDDSLGIYIEYENNYLNFMKNYITSYGESSYPLFIYSFDNNFVFRDTKLESNSDIELFIGDNILSGNWDFVNTTLDNIFYDTNSFGILNYSNYIHVFINSSLGEPIENVSIALKDKYEIEISRKNTNNNGETYFIATQYLKNSSESIDYLSNYTLEINNSNNISINLTGNKNIYYNIETGDETTRQLGGSGNNLRLIVRNITKKNIILSNESTLNKIKKPERKTLFDISLRLLSKEIKPGEKISGIIGLINVALPGKVNANLYYKITDINGNIYLEEDETVPVETQTEFIKEFDTSQLNEGDYKIFVKLDYLGQTEPAESEDAFSVQRGLGEKVANLLQGKIIYMGLVSFLISGIMTILLHFYELKIKLKKI